MIRRLSAALAARLAARRARRQIARRTPLLADLPDALLRDVGLQRTGFPHVEDRIRMGLLF